jgi:hypothetical protein
VTRHSPAVRGTLLALVGAALIGNVALARDSSAVPRRMHADPGLLSVRDIARFDEYLSQIYDESGVEVGSSTRARSRTAISSRSR